MVPLPTLTAESLLLFGGQKAQTTLSYYGLSIVHHLSIVFSWMDFFPGRRKGFFPQNSYWKSYVQVEYLEFRYHKIVPISCFDCLEIECSENNFIERKC